MLKSIKERFLNNLLPSKVIPIVLSVWILSLTVYYCIDVPWLSFFSSGEPDTKQLIEEALRFYWIPVFLSRLPYLFYALILNFIALLIGNRILRWLKVDFNSNLNRIIFSIPLGWGIYSIGIFYFGISGLLYKEAVYCFLTLLGVLSILEIERFYGEWKTSTTASKFKINKTDLVFLPVIIISLTFWLVTSFCPVGGGDPLIYHMALPKLYIKHHAFVHIPGFLFSTLPAHTEMLYLLGLITSGETLSKLFSFSISSMFLISIFSIGNRHFSKGVGYLATVIMMQAGLFFTSYFSEPWTDMALGLFSLLGVYAFFLWIEDLPLRQAQGKPSNEVKESRRLNLERKEGHLYLSIICCALAAATKVQGLFFVLLFFAGFLVTVKLVVSKANIRDRLFSKNLAWCILAIGIIALPWYIRSWWLTGDPVFPFLYKYLGAKHWNEYSNECFWEYLSHPAIRGAKNFSDFIRINKDIFFSGFGISSLPPIIATFLLPALITLRNRNKLIIYLLFISLGYYIFFIFTSHQIRFFYVGLAILSIIVAHFIKTVWIKYLLARIPIILCIVALSAASFFAFAGNLKVPFFAGLGVLNRRQFLNDSDYYLRESSKAATWVNENLPQDSKILSWCSYGNYLDREYMPVNPAYQGILDFNRINDAQTFLKNIKEIGITHLLYQFTASYISKRPKEFLDKCVLELLESGKIALIKQVDSYTIYSTVEPEDYFVLDDNIIRFYDESQRKYLVKGWYFTEGWGTWSDGEESLIILNFREPKDYTMLIKATGFSVPDKQQNVRIYLDDNLLGEYTFTQQTTHIENFEMKIPSAYIKEGIQQIRFVYGFTGSPAEYGTNHDIRQLAMGIRLIEFK